MVAAGGIAGSACRWAPSKRGSAASGGDIGFATVSLGAGAAGSGALRREEKPGTGIFTSSTKSFGASSLAAITGSGSEATGTGTGIASLVTIAGLPSVSSAVMPIDVAKVLTPKEGSCGKFAGVVAATNPIGAKPCSVAKASASCRVSFATAAI